VHEMGDVVQFRVNVGLTRARVILRRIVHVLPSHRRVRVHKMLAENFRGFLRHRPPRLSLEGSGGRLETARPISLVPVHISVKVACVARPHWETGCVTGRDPRT
jgi:hypothetical protein